MFRRYRIRQCYQGRRCYYVVDKRSLLFCWMWTGPTFMLLDDARRWIDEQKVVVKYKSTVVEYR